jgi:hypothetical protein
LDIELQRIKRIRLVLVSIAMFFVVVCSVAYISQPVCREWDRSIYYKFPASVRNIEEQSSAASRSCKFSIKFEINPNDVDSLVKSTFIEPPLSAAYLPKSIGGIENLRNSTGWNVNTNVPFLAGEGRGQN